ncbi:hypothetical protein [Chitinophaga caseinilytica]|uniref:Uncharacterized protein n=1 Tax=Chitinophaga caseinilytica TaxID=2267521 RepID=A0ABZ2YZ56_9BACT
MNASAKLTPGVVVAMLIWWPVLAIFSRKGTYVKRVQTFLSVFTMIFAGISTVLQIQHEFVSDRIVFLLLLTGFYIILLLLFRSRKNLTGWGSLLFIAMGAGIAWFEQIVVFCTGFGRDYLPGSWGYERDLFETMTAVAMLVLAVACGFAALWMPPPGKKTASGEAD